MRKIVSLALAYAILFASPVLADINCSGDVTVVMDYPTYCNGNTAFKTSTSNGKKRGQVLTFDFENQSRPFFKPRCAGTSDTFSFQFGFD